MNEHFITDMSGATPAAALATSPAADKWMVLPYEGPQISGKMVWAPARSKPPDIAVQLPDLGLCKIYVGIYASGEAPVWLHVHFGRQKGVKPWNRLYLRLSDEDWFDFIVPDAFPEQPVYHYISESLWKTADVSGKSLVLAPPRKEALLETTVCVAYIRLVPVARAEPWPKQTKRLACYYDGTFMGHFVANTADVKTEILPLAQSDCELIFWNTCYEDTCFYPTKAGHQLPDHKMPGAYPHWLGHDLQKMLARGEDPLQAACATAHGIGLKIFGSYRRLTSRIAPHVFPMHPEAMLAKRRDLWCRQADGDPVPQLSLAYPEVGRQMIALFVEQAENYDLDGVHMFFCRGVPFVLFEKPFVDAFIGEYGYDPRRLPVSNPWIWKMRAKFFIQFLRDLRQALEATGKKKQKRLEIALTVMNSPAVCAYFGMDIAQMARERLVDILVPFPCHYLPEEIGEWRHLPEYIAEFARLTRDAGIRLYPDCGYDYSDGRVPLEKRAEAFYRAGAHGLQVSQKGVRGEGQKREDAVARRLGHLEELAQAPAWRAEAARAIKITKVAGFRLDRCYGLVTCG